MKNVFLNVRTAKAQAGCAKLKDTSLSFRRGLGRGFLFTFLLLTLGVGQMWADKVTVKFKFAAGQTAWSTVNVYTFDGDNSHNSWPGNTTNVTRDGDWYVFQLEYNASIIFNNGSGTQTQNLTHITSDVCYVWVNNSDKAKEDLNCDGVIDGADTRYYYRGTSNSWGATAMTPHGSGLYSYIGTYTKNNEFKISLSSGGWDYGWDSNVHDNTFNGGVSDGLEGSSGNYKIKTSSSVYIIVYYPNTSLNNTNKPKINVRTSLYNPSYTITLDKNGGSRNGNASVTYNATSLSSISAPTRTGYDVEGYYANSICTTKVATPAGALQASTTYTDASKKWTSASNQTLYTKWTPKTYNITYKDQGNVTFSGVHEEGYPTTHTYGTATALDSPTKDGYLFGGWYTNSTCTTSAGSSIGATSKTADFTLYAKWTEKTYSLTFSHNGHGTIKVGGSTVSSGSTTSVNHITTKALVAEASSGYHFTGWTVSGTNNDKVTIADKTSTGTSTTIKATAAGATVTAGFAADAASYTITYDAGNSPYNNGSVSESHSYASGSSQTSGTEISLTATPTNSHYKLEGWYSDAACTSAIAGAGTSNPYEFTLGDNTSVYAKFVLKTCAITLNRNGATAGAESVTARHGETLSSFIAHSLADYTLQGYYTTASGGTKIIDANGAFVASTTYANVSKQWDNDATALTLYAQLAQTITLDANTANHGSGDNTSATATYNGTSPVSGFSATSAATGYQLEGYYSDPTSGVKVLNSNGTYASDNVTGYITSGKWTKSGATTLYAHLTAKTYSITLNANDGSSGGSATATYNSNKLTSITAPSKSGYDIMGYYKEPGCTNLIADASGNLQAGTTYTDASGNWTSNSSQTLYPKWGLQLPAALQLDGQLSGGWDNCKLMNKSNRLFSYTVYSVSAGTYEFCFKNGSCGSTALLKPNMSICNSKKNAGNITWEDAGGEYHNFRITTTSEGDVTITVEYGETTALVTVNHTSVPSISSGWFLRGDPFEGWNSDNNSYPFNRSYRGIDGVYYRVFDFAGQTDKWFKPCKGTNEYGQSTGADINISENTQYLVVKDKSGDNTSFKPNGLHQVWCIIDENSNKFWVQSPDAYYTMSVTSDHGTVTLTENVYGNLQTNQFEAGETVNISVSAASGYWIDDIELNGTPLVTDRNSGSWSGSTTMPAGNATLTVTYNRYYTLTYDANYYTSETGGTAPSASSYVSGSNVTVVGKGDLTMTNYTFSGWNTDPHITGTNYAEGANIEMTGNITLYGVWKRTIPFELEDADPEFVMATVYGTYNCTTLTDYDNPTKDGYTFGGWWTNIAGGNNYVISPEKELQPGVYHWTNYDNKTNEFMRYPTSISSLYAKWTQTVTLDANLANHGSGDNTSATIVYKATAKTSITHCTPATGYHLVGYYTAATDGVKVLNADGSFAGTSVTDYITDSKWTKAGATTLYAHYEANTYTIAFDPNDANYVGEATGTTASIDATYGVSYLLTANGFTREGYTFAGWATSPTGAKVYNDGQSVSNLTSTNGATVTLYAKWTGTTYTVTFNARGGSDLSINSKPVTMGSAYGELATVTPPAGYVFDGWYTSAGGGTKVTSATQVTTAVDHTLYARYIQKAQVYFKNTIGWSQVWVTYDANWDGTQGTGNQGKTYHQMKLVSGTTDIYYDDIPDEYITSWRWNIAFNNLDYSSTPFYAFDNGEAVFRYDFDKNATMFVPTSNTGTSADGNYTKNDVQYRSTGYSEESSGPKYTSGYWRTYNDTYSGYTLTYQKKGGSWSGGHKMESAKVGDNVFCFTVNMEANSQYNFSFYKNYNLNNKSKQFCYNPSTQINSSNCTNLQLDCNPNNSYMQTTVAGEYTFQLEMKADGHMYLSVIYPLAVGDFRVRYNYTKGSAKTYYSEIIKGRANGKDTISIFIHSKDSASSRSLTVEKCTGISSGTPTWNTSYLDVTSKLPAATTAGGKTSGVYDFIITQNGSKEIILDNFSYWKQYTGNYYIRTQCADGGWDFYRERSDNLMTLSEYSLTQTLSAPYSHYYCRFISDSEISTTDISYAVATDYSPNISGTMVGDATIGGDAVKVLPASANVRFSWNEETNAMRRAYLKNAQTENARFLVLHGSDSKVLSATGSTISAKDDLQDNELKFTDMGNWIYQVNLQAQPGAEVSLIANYNGADRYLIGGATSFLTIIDGEGSAKYEMIAVYDFKTNRLMIAWTPSGEVGQNLTDVDVLLVRYKQNAGTVITLGTGKSVTSKTVIGAIRFDYNDLVGHVADWNRNSRPLLKYFISFPFDVNVSDIFGLNSAYGDAYEIQMYDGAERARKGFFRGDGTTTFWKTLQPGDVMKANEGYCVIMDNDYLNNDVGHVWDNKGSGSTVYLYFPSAGNVGSIASTSQTISIPSRPCTIDRTFTTHQGSTREVNHINTDSHWNMMGVPIFDTHSDPGTSGQPGAVFATSGTDGDGNFNYFYEWNPSNNQYSIHTAVNYSFMCMHGYMVQYHGNVTFKTAAAPASVAARRAPQKENYQIELQVLNNNADVLNSAFVELRENACDTFELNEDVYMSFNNLAVNIYTLAGNYDVAANVLSVGNHTIPVCVEVTKAGTYTFSMPSNFSGTATLVDSFTGERTNLALDDYEVNLQKGVIEDRFLLEIDVQKVATAIDGTTGSGSLKDGNAHKFLQNGMMYILQNGMLYDAQGKRVQ